MKFRTGTAADGDFWDREDVVTDPGGQSEDGDFRAIHWTPELLSELLDPASWGAILELYARTTKLAVALMDADGKLVGSCHNPQPIWKLTRNTIAARASGCFFCLDTESSCSASADALRTGALTLAHDQAGFAHVALPLMLGGRHLGTLLAGQILDRYPEPLPLQRVARSFGVSAQELWRLAVQQIPTSRDSLTVYGELLGALSQSFLRGRYGRILETRWTATAKALNQELATVNSTLEHKVTELDRSQSDLENLFESTQITTIFLDRELRLKKVTPDKGSFVQLETTDIGRAMADLALPFAETGVAEQIAEAIETLPMGSRQECPLVHERYLTGVNGKHYLMRILPYRTAEQVVDGAVITFVDVTRLKNAEQQAEAAKIYAESIVATVRHPLLVLDDMLRVKSANEAFYNVFRVRPGDTEGRLVYELGNGQWDIPELRLLLNELLPRNQWVQDFEIQHDYAHIGPKTMLLNAHRIDHVELILLAIEDITQQKAAQTLLQNVNLNLKHFAYAASHDLQEPLRMAKIYAQWLGREYKGKFDAQGDEFIGRTIEAVSQVEMLLEDLREYWLVNEPLANLVPVDCEQVVQKTMQALRVPITESGAILTHDPLPTVSADQTGFAMLLQNLVGNAIKYRRLGEQPQVHIAAEQKNHQWRFSVKDNGIGIETEYLEQIFAPFKRLHGQDYPGTGIGLALCKKIVERYGGELWVESCPGQGSTFFFTIPTSWEPAAS